MKRARPFLLGAVCCLATVDGCTQREPALALPSTCSAPIAVTQATDAGATNVAVADEAMPSPEEACKRFSSTPIPAADLPSPSAQAEFHGCDAQAFYYGIGMPIDFVKARQCAYVERQGGSAPVIGGAAILMMLYANGQGVPTNLDLALRFACEVEGAPAELEARIARLWNARVSHTPLGTLDICDEITSGFMGGFCTARGERLAAVVRDQRKRAAVAGMPAAELATLEAAAKRFFELRSDEEVDKTGTLRAAFMIEEQARLEDELVSALEQLREPSFVPERGDAGQLEKSIATTLARLNNCKAFAEMEKFPGAVTRAGIRETQGVWLRHRSAFVALALALHPQTPRAVWQAWLDRGRLRQLEELVRGC